MIFRKKNFVLGLFFYSYRIIEYVILTGIIINIPNVGVKFLYGTKFYYWIGIDTPYNIINIVK